MRDKAFGWLDRFGDACALISEDGQQVTYRQLADSCRQVLAGMPTERQLVLLEVRNDIASIVAYLACLGGGHCPILVGDDGGNGHRRIVDAFHPNLLWRNGGFTRLDGAPGVEIHPELALLLPTSGSTGSPKLVRLSTRNIESNARSIVEYLQIGSSDRAITSLPFHYSFGMSVVNSHLMAGGSLVVTDVSVTNPEFWTLFREHSVTSFAGVPYSYELLERIRFRNDPPSSLRVMTQAGGKLAPDLVKTYAEFCRDRGGRFFTMYGQTEAAPRMAYLPSDIAAENPDCVGVAIPGGSFHLLDEDDREISAPDTVGQLVYRGPNVMMGYAFSRDDLAKGYECSELRTGDLAVKTRRGLYKIVGRASRFVKIAGLRIGLDDVEALLAEAGSQGKVSGADGLVVACVTGNGDPAQAREFIAHQCGLPGSTVMVFHRPEPPRLASGKVDYAEILRVGRQMAIDEGKRASESGGVIGAVYAKALGVPVPPGEASFASLGGDSLSYVNASIGIERALGHLPAGWETMSVSSLEAMAPIERVLPPSSTWVGSELLVRLAALSLVMIGHAAPDETLWLRGGSNVLFALAGYNLARFQSDALLRGEPGSAILGSLYRVILPYLVLAAVMLPVSEADKSLGWLFLVSVFTVEFRGPLFAFWFIESVFHALLITCVLFLVPAVRNFARARPFESALIFIAGAVATKYAVPPLWNDGRTFHLTVDALLYNYFLGWAAYMAGTKFQKLIVLAIAVVLAGLDYGILNSRQLWLSVSLAVVMFTRGFRLPNLPSSLLLNLAAASYFIYLTHVLVVHVVVHMLGIENPALTIPAVLLASASMGWAYAQIWNSVTPKIVTTARSILSRGSGRAPTE